jgi:rhodanese-related sulfurtransferase
VFAALPIGLAFGVLLERGGLASARTIADQLTFRDFTVVKVMLSAIVTAMLGLFWAERLGWLDLSRVGVPVTDIVPQLFGAVVFGAGFALAALCPGTACAAVATGRGDGLAVIGGLFVGTLATMLAWPELGSIATRAPREAAFLPADLGVPAGVVIALLTVAAVVVLPWLAKFEGQDATRRGLTPLAGGALALGLLAIPAAGYSRGVVGAEADLIAREIAAERDHVEATQLAEWIRDDRPRLRVIDVRDDLSPDDYVIPGAEQVPLAMLHRLAIDPGDQVVLYSDGGAHAAQAWVLLRTQGHRNVAVLHDGLAAWEDDILSPLPPLNDDPADVARWEKAKELSAWFGGMPRTTRPPDAPAASRPRRRNTC